MTFKTVSKSAAHFYQSQISPDRRPVLQAATVWSMGDRNGGGVKTLVIFSNCDQIEVYVGDTLYGCYSPDRETFPNLPHPPFQITGLGWPWGDALRDLRLVGYLDGQPVAEQNISPDGQPVSLILAADHTELYADEADMTRLVFKIVDRHGNRLPYANRVVTFEADGPVDLIGENPFALVGGQAAVYIRTRNIVGTATIRAKTAQLSTAEVTIQIVQPANLMGENGH